MEVNTFISKLVSSGVPAMTPVVPPQPAATSLSHFRTPAATSTTNFSPISEAGSDAASSSYDFDPGPLPAPPPPVSAFATTAPKRHAPHQPHPDLNQVLQAIADMENRLTRRIEAVAADVDVLRQNFEVLGATIHRCSLESRLCAEKLNENLRAGFSHVSGLVANEKRNIKRAASTLQCLLAPPPEKAMMTTMTTTITATTPLLP